MPAVSWFLATTIFLAICAAAIAFPFLFGVNFLP
jgi:hypothetical protein